MTRDAHTDTPSELTEPSELAELPERLTAAWNAGDAAAFAALFTEDADYVTFQGVRLRGREEIERAHALLFAGPLRGSRLVAGRTDVRTIGEGVAVLVSTGNAMLAGQDVPDPARKSIQTLVAVEQDGAWRFASFQNTRIQPDPVRGGAPGGPEAPGAGRAVPGASR